MKVLFLLKNLSSLLLIPTFFILISCNNLDDQKDSGNPEIKFAHLDFDFGTIKQGEKVAHRFVFKNSGNGKLLIKNVSAECGCTIASHPEKEINPGEESFIEATFNSEGYRGLTIKQVEVFSNAEPKKTVLTFSANVETE